MINNIKNKPIKFSSLYPSFININTLYINNFLSFCALYSNFYDDLEEDMLAAYLCLIGEEGLSLFLEGLDFTNTTKKAKKKSYCYKIKPRRK